jgi:hypothetical protein
VNSNSYFWSPSTRAFEHLPPAGTNAHKTPVPYAVPPASSPPCRTSSLSASTSASPSAPRGRRSALAGASREDCASPLRSPCVPYAPRAAPRRAEQPPRTLRLPRRHATIAGRRRSHIMRSTPPSSQLWRPDVMPRHGSSGTAKPYRSSPRRLPCRLAGPPCHCWPHCGRPHRTNQVRTTFVFGLACPCSHRFYF